MVFAVLGLDLYLKYRKVKNLKEFVRKHWLDILMIAFLPLFAGFKIAKIAVKAVKGAKLAKSGFKAFRRQKAQQGTSRQGMSV